MHTKWVCQTCGLLVPPSPFHRLCQSPSWEYFSGFFAHVNNKMFSMRRFVLWQLTRSFSTSLTLTSTLSFFACIWSCFRRRGSKGARQQLHMELLLSLSLSRLIVYGVIKWRLLPQCVVDVSVIATSLLVSVSLCVCMRCVCVCVCVNTHVTARRRLLVVRMCVLVCFTICCLALAHLFTLYLA